MTRATRSRRLVLVFGEIKNDADSIKELVVHCNPALGGRVLARPKPASLVKGAGRDAIGRWIDQIGDVIAVEKRRGRQIGAVLVHRDADGPDAEGRVEEDLGRQLLPVRGVPVVPVQMIEAWWFLFPDATESIKPLAWRGVLPRAARDVETITNPKKELERLTRPHAYVEADSPAIAIAVRETGASALGRSASYSRFAVRAGALA